MQSMGGSAAVRFLLPQLAPRSAAAAGVETEDAGSVHGRTVAANDEAQAHHSSTESATGNELPVQKSGKRRFEQVAESTFSKEVAQFASAKGWNAQDLRDLRDATADISVSIVYEAADPTLARFLRASAIEPIKQKIATDPRKSTFQNEQVLKLTSAGNTEFSNYIMHLADGGQDGVHVHPYGPRNLVVISDTPWAMLCGRTPRAGEDPAGIRRVTKIVFPAGQIAVSFPANKPHGFEATGDGTVAYSVHAFDQVEVQRAGVRDDKDLMAALTRDLGSEGLTLIGDCAVPCQVVLALHADEPGESL